MEDEAWYENVVGPVARPRERYSTPLEGPGFPICCLRVISLLPGRGIKGLVGAFPAPTTPS